MGMPTHVRKIPQEHITHVRGMERLNLSMLGAVEVVNVVTLNGLMEKREAQSQNQCDHQQRLPDGHHLTGVPGSSVQTSVPGRSRNRSASCSGLPVKAGKVPKCSGIKRRTLSMRHARAASRGLMVYRSPIG